MLVKRSLLLRCIFVLVDIVVSVNFKEATGKYKLMIPTCFVANHVCHGEDKSDCLASRLPLMIGCTNVLYRE